MSQLLRYFVVNSRTSNSVDCSSSCSGCMILLFQANKAAYLALPDREKRALAIEARLAKMDSCVPRCFMVRWDHDRPYIFRTGDHELSSETDKYSLKGYFEPHPPLQTWICSGLITGSVKIMVADNRLGSNEDV